MGEESSYHIGLACENGDPLDGMADLNPDDHAAFCEHCGAPTLSACPSCKAPIRGHMREVLPKIIPRFD